MKLLPSARPHSASPFRQKAGGSTGVRRCQTPDTHIARCGWFGGLIRWFHFPTQVHTPAPYYTPLSSVDLRRPSLSLESLGCVLRGNSHLKFSTPFTSAASTTTTTPPPPLPHDDLKAQRPSRSLSRSTSTSTARRILSNRPSGSRPCAEPWIDCSPFPRRSPPPPFRPHTTIHPSVCLSVCTSSLLAQTSPHLTSPPLLDLSPWARCHRPQFALVLAINLESHDA
ncbi:uncharacterized protein K444DRAFT_87233 [Hyaloscypha bicolor E]|uniref:Uncharacterized protein n=1 Tax=Hyaloscypha bicolor E TaxID=1095630 RepID=A0A2J6SZ06_9HELO|nr:uncharacterized protein K444DRAFT_87233 [Hyaloscypha bicolor E]PMD56008.1 hypothetical protein K444DRAFT_87233 [Hyaloscypha bicolor E]